MQNEILEHLNSLRGFLTHLVERANERGIMTDQDWPQYTAHMALLKQLIDGAPVYLVKPGDTATDPELLALYKRYNDADSSAKAGALLELRARLNHLIAGGHKPHTKAWAVARAAFMTALDVGNESEPLCGCGLPATRSDRHGYPICDTCNDLLEQAERKGLPE